MQENCNPGATDIFPDCGEEVHASLRANRIVKLPDQASLVAVTASAPVVVTWDHDGEVVGLRGDTVADGSLAGRASIGVKIKVSGGMPVTSLANAGGETYVPFSQLHGPDAAALFRRKYKAGDVWTVAFYNFNAVTAYVPGLTFLCRQY